MSCAYCGQEGKKTKEHIISSCLLDLFPECFLTIDENRGVAHGADPTVNDVCSDCNSTRLAYIDSYAGQFIQKYFTREYDPEDDVEIEYDYCLLQKMLLKFAFNDIRANRYEDSFFNSEIIEYLLNEEDNTPKQRVIILAGLSINTSQIPAFVFGNMKLRWCRAPLLLSNSIIEHIDYAAGQYYIREFQRQELTGLVLSYVFKFNSGQFILLCWDEMTPKVEENVRIIEFQYPYTLLRESPTIISRCTSDYTFHRFNIIDVTWGQGMMDEISTMRKLASDPNTPGFDKSLWELEEKRLAEKHRR